VCLIGVVVKDDPQCMIFENLSQGDLHEFLIAHSPKSDLCSDDGLDRTLDPTDMSFIAIQVPIQCTSISAPKKLYGQIYI
jgi:receptor tyrosine kinase-like orphan receptor 1